MEEKKQTGWGGKRANAGRKRKEHGKYYGFISSIEVDAILQQLSGSKTEFINDAILHYAHTKNLI